MLFQACGGLGPDLCAGSQTVDQLTEVERTVLAERKASLLSTLDQGFGPLTWTSLCIPEFIASVQQVRSAARV